MASQDIKFQLLDKIDNIKTSLRDNDYKQIVELLSKIKDETTTYNLNILILTPNVSSATTCRLECTCNACEMDDREININIKTKETFRLSLSKLSYERIKNIIGSCISDILYKIEILDTEKDQIHNILNALRHYDNTYEYNGTSYSSNRAYIILNINRNELV
jgi:hypothetical protein